MYEQEIRIMECFEIISGVIQGLLLYFVASAVICRLYKWSLTSDNKFNKRNQILLSSLQKNNYFVSFHVYWAHDNDIS